MRAWTVNDVDTGQFELLDIEVTDPCQTATLLINNEVFKTKTDLTLLQFVEYASRQVSWTDNIVSSSISDTNNPCGPYIHELWDIGTGSQVVLDSNVFTQSDLSLPTKTLDVQTDDFSKVALYDLRLVVYYTNSPDKQFSKEFLIDIQDYCVPTLVTKTSQFDPISV